MVPTLRPKGMETPCDKCPKRGPQYESQYVLNSTNEKLLTLRERLLKSKKYGQRLELSGDLKRSKLLADNLALVDEIYEQHERDANATAIAVKLAPFMIR